MPAEAFVTASAGVRDLAMALTVGGLVSVAMVFPAGSAAAQKVAGLVRWAAMMWAVAAASFALTSYWAISLTSPSDPHFGVEAWSFLTNIPLGQAYLQMAVAAVLASIVVGLVRTPLGAAWALVPTVWALGAQAVTGHAAGTSSHHLAVSAMFVHVVGASLWLGVVAALIAARNALADGAKAAIVRTSAVATWAVLMIVVSGAINSTLRLSALGDLWGTSYGRLLMFKVMMFLGLVALAARYRRRLLPRLDNLQVREAFWKLISIDVGMLVAISVVAAILAGMAPPAPIEVVLDPTPAWILTGYPLPPAPSIATWMTLWRLDLIPAFACAASVVVYVRWVMRLHRRGDRWPWCRTAAWLGGIAVLVWATQGGPAVYGPVAFSSHMLAHMILASIVPIGLTLGAPVTLALRALPHRSDDSRGPREWLRAFVESRPLHLLANPVVAAVNFAGSMVLFYYTPIFGWVLHNHVGHIWMEFHFVMVGYLFVNALIGVDPGPRRPMFPIRLGLLFATMTFHAFFGVALMSATALLVPRWFGLMGRDWGPDALHDQAIGGQLAWGIGEIPVVVLAIAVVGAWRRSDDQQSARQDRRAARDGDSDLVRYNAMLAEINRRDE